jgi:glycerol-3-phosphate dehydrogenase
VADTDTVMAEVAYAVQHEMALRLADVILRRTDLGSGSHPGEPALTGVALGMQPLLGWSDQKREEEIAHTQGALRRHRAAQPGRNGARQ